MNLPIQARSMAHTKARLTLRPIKPIPKGRKMRLYLEVLQTMTEEEMLLGQPQSVRLEVSDRADAIETLKEVRKRFVDLKWKAFFHSCRHEDGPESCSVELLEERV